MTISTLSPVSLLSDLAEQGSQLTDVLILAFNHDLSFFEREALGPLQGRGARLTVIGDAHVTGHDVFAVRHAGISYLPGLAACAGAFHPKLVAIIGEDEVTVLVGSGNLTLAGWRGNDEIWSLHRSGKNGGSHVPSQVGSFLTQLPEVVQVIPAVAESLRRVGASLSAMPGTERNHQIVHSLRQPIVDQLPRGPVNELLLYAPFHDPSATALKALIERFEPTVVRVAYQPESTHIAGAEVVNLLGNRGDMYAIANSPYRHGKLIEWSIGDSRWSLTGSPNLSSSALLRTASTGGNVELGVISPLTESLMPVPTRDQSDVLTLPVFPARSTQPLVRDVILAAIIVDSRLTITTARPLSADAHVEYYQPDGPAERWTAAGVIKAGFSEHHIDADAKAGARLRLSFADGRTTSIAFVANLETVNNSRQSGRPGPPIPKIEDVLTNAETAEKFWNILLSESRRVKAPRGLPHSSRPKQREIEPSEVAGDWGEYLDRCRGQFGSQLMAFALGLREISARSPSAPTTYDWDSEEPINDQVGVLDGDTPDMPEPDDPNRTLTHSLQISLADKLRSKYQTFAKKRADETSTTEPHETLVALRLILLLAAGEVWPSADLTWTELVLQATGSLDSSDGDELEASAGSLSALALAIVDYSYSISRAPVNRTLFDNTVDKVRHLLVAADTDRIEEYRSGLNRFAHFTHPDDVLNLRDLLVTNNPVDLSLKALEDAGVDFTQVGPLLIINTETSNPLENARRIASLTQGLDTIAVRAPGKKEGQWAAFIRSSGDQIEIQTGSLPRSVLIDHLRANEDRWKLVARTNAKDPLPDETVATLKTIGITIEDLHDI